MSTGKARDWSKVKRSPRVRYTVWFTPEQDEYVRLQADAGDLSLSEYLRSMALDASPVRQRPRPNIDRQLCAALLAELGKVGSNVNQIARTGNQMGVLHSEDLKILRRLSSDIGDMRDALMQALGVEP